MKHNPSPIETSSSRLLGTIAHVRPRNWGASRSDRVVAFFHGENERTNLWVPWIRKKQTMLGGHPWKLTCPLKSDHSSREYIFQPSIFRGHVSFQGSNVYWCHWNSIMTLSFRLHYESWLWLSHETHQFKIQHHDSSKYVLQFHPGSIIQVRELFIYVNNVMYDDICDCPLMRKPHVWSKYYVSVFQVDVFYEKEH